MIFIYKICVFVFFFVYLRERLKDYERLWSGTVMSREKVIGTHNF